MRCRPAASIRRLGLRASLVSLAALSSLACAGGNSEGKCPATPSATTTSATTTVARGGVLAENDVDARLRQVLAGPQRSGAHRARDVYRHPRETLEFFGVKTTSKVLELSPGGGWYTEILGPLLKDQGELTVTNGNENGPPEQEGTKDAKALLDKLHADPASYANVKVVHMITTEPFVLAPEGSQDVVLTFRNLHNWTDEKVDSVILAAAFKALKSGGTLGIVDHRAAPGADPVKSSANGYLPEAYVVALVQKAGFRLAEKSEINANPKDTKDYPEGVWTLPPSYRLGEKDHAKYQEIGESDRMTLRFIKP
jgi:predicted methyltransferase